jgi:hypothetical protein
LLGIDGGYIAIHLARTRGVDRQPRSVILEEEATSCKTILEDCTRVGIIMLFFSNGFHSIQMQ